MLDYASSSAPRRRHGEVDSFLVDIECGVEISSSKNSGKGKYGWMWWTMVAVVMFLLYMVVTRFAQSVIGVLHWAEAPNLKP